MAPFYGMCVPGIRTVNVRQLDAEWSWWVRSADACCLCVVCWYSDQSPAEADLNYLSNATKMEFYGVELQDAQVTVC